MKYAFLCRKPVYTVNKRVAIVGAGPAGLTVAGYLACRGYEVDVYDKLPYPGGLMTFAIPRSRINVDDVFSGWRDLEENFSVKFYFKTKVSAGEGVDEGDDFVEKRVNLLELSGNYDAVVVATGTWKSRRLGIEGEDSRNVVTALSFLYHERLRELKLLPEMRINPPQRAVVIGAGLSAIDAAEECLSLGAREVYLVYRRSIKEAPAGAYRVRELVGKGVKWVELAQPVRIISEGGLAKGVEFVRVKLGERDETGRPRPVPVPGTEFIIEADLVVEAVGEGPTPPIYQGDLLKHVDKSGKLVVDSNFRIPGTNIFAVGDVVNGATKVGLAVDHALKAVVVVDKVISGEKVSLEEILGKLPPAEKPRLRVSKWESKFGEELCKYLDSRGLLKYSACTESMPFTRVFDYSKCIGCETCSAVCGFMHGGKSLLKVNRTEDGLVYPVACLHCSNAKCQVACKREAIVRGDLGEVLIDYKKCNRCMDCLSACPVRAIRLSRGEVVNCDLCLPLRRAGLEPACISMCPANAITLVTK